jgi:hypothetical protein
MVIFSFVRFVPMTKGPRRLRPERVDYMSDFCKERRISKVQWRVGQVLALAWLNLSTTWLSGTHSPTGTVLSDASRPTTDRAANQNLRHARQRKNGISFEQKAEWMREKHSGLSAPAQGSPAYAERHFSPAEIAAMWNLSEDAVRKLFQNEPGVLVHGHQGSRTKRRYTTLRIPTSVVERVHRRLSNV